MYLNLLTVIGLQRSGHLGDLSYKMAIHNGSQGAEGESNKIVLDRKKTVLA